MKSYQTVLSIVSLLRGLKTDDRLFFFPFCFKDDKPVKIGVQDGITKLYTCAKLNYIQMQLRCCARS